MSHAYHFLVEKTLVKEISFFTFVKEEDLININKPIYGETTVYYRGYVEKLQRRMTLVERKTCLEMIMLKCFNNIEPTAIYKMI